MIWVTVKEHAPAIKDNSPAKAAVQATIDKAAIEPADKTATQGAGEKTADIKPSAEAKPSEDKNAEKKPSEVDQSQATTQTADAPKKLQPKINPMK